MLSRRFKDVGNASMRSAAMTTSTWSASSCASHTASTAVTSSSSSHNLSNSIRSKNNGSLDSLFKYNTPNTSSDNIKFKSNVKVILIPSKSEYKKAGLYSDMWFSNDEIEQQRLDSEREIRSYMKSNKCDFSAAKQALYQGSPISVDSFLKESDKNEGDFYIINDIDGFYIDDSAGLVGSKSSSSSAKAVRCDEAMSALPAEDDWFIGETSPIGDPSPIRATIDLHTAITNTTASFGEDEDRDVNTSLQFQLE